jgi:4-alpha-glucanotransferase
LDYREALNRAAARWEVELGYHDAWGQWQQASEESLQATLAVLGGPAGSAEDIERALEQRALVEWSGLLDSAIVLRQDAGAIPLRIPAGCAGDSFKFEFQWENGETEHHWFWMPELGELERATVSGREFIAKRVPLPKPLRLGYHTLRVLGMQPPESEVVAQAKLIVCPPRVLTAESRMAGVAVSLFGVRSGRNWGCGDFSDLHALADVFAPAGAAFLALNPLPAIPNRQPFNTSPYLPLCSLYRNFIYLDVERAPGYQPSLAWQQEAQSLRETEFVEYERVAQLKLAALGSAFSRLQASGGDPGFEEYQKREGAPLHDFAVYCALDEEMHRRDPNAWGWTDWPEPYRDPRSASVARFAEEYRDRVQFHAFLQWQVDCQLAEAQAHALASGMKIGLYHDLALATDRFGADLWADRPFYASGARVGAPPDKLAPSGQDWGFPPPNRDAHRASGYELFARTIRNNARHGGALRIDHVMRFFRLYWIPNELSPSQGAYVRDYANDLLGVLALESVRGRFIVIGEDLGTVEESFRHKLGETGILGYRVLWFERELDGRFRQPGEYAAHAAVTTTTHDLPTLAGFPHGRDIEARRAAGLIDEAAYHQQWDTRRDELHRLEEALEAAGFRGDPLGFVLATPSVVAIINQEDLTGETEQQNLPASTWQHPNWRRKMRLSIEELGPVAEDLRRRIEQSGRR